MRARADAYLEADVGLEIFAASLCAPHSRSAADLAPRYVALLGRLESLAVKLEGRPMRMRRASFQLVGSMPIAWPYLGYSVLSPLTLLGRIYDAVEKPEVATGLVSGRTAARVTKLAIVAELGQNTSPGLLFEQVFIGLCTDAKLRVVFVSPTALQTPFAQTARKYAAEIVDLPFSIQEAMAAIAALEADVLLYLAVGLNAFTYQLARHRVCPVQMTFAHGHPISSGLETIDYFVSSRHFEADEFALTTAASGSASGSVDGGEEARGDGVQAYIEQLVLFDSLTTGMIRPKLDHSLTRRALGLPETTLYACLQHSKKLHPDFDAALFELVQLDATATIVMLQGASTHLPRWQARNISRKNFLFLPRMPRERLLAIVAVADAFLDTYPWGGGVTSYEALSLGTPVVILPAKTTVLQLALGQLRKLGLENDLAATDVAHYARIAAKLGTDATFRLATRRRIQKRCADLFDAAEAVREWAAFVQRVGSPGSRREPLRPGKSPRVLSMSVGRSGPSEADRPRLYQVNAG